MGNRRKIQPRRLSTRVFGDMNAMPEHAKMAPHVSGNWDIRRFLEFLRERDIELSYSTSGVVRSLSADGVEHALMRFRGVDPDAYRKESAELVRTYGQLVTRHLLPPSDGEAEQLALIDEDSDPDVIKIIRVLDELGVPSWAGRPTCSQAMFENGITVPKTDILARAVKFRKMLYGATEVGGQFTSNDPRNRHNQPPRLATDNEQAAIDLLMAKLKGKDDAAQD